VAETLRATGRAADALVVLDRVGALLFVERAGGKRHAASTGSHAAVVDGRLNDSAAGGSSATFSSPDALAWRCARGACLHALGDLRGAFASFTECLRHDPAHVGALKALGWLYQQRGATEEATETFKLALARAPADAELRRTLAATLTDLGTKTKLRGDPVGAIALYEEASAVDEAYAPTRYNLGVLYGELGRNDEAAARYAEATSLDPAHAEAHCNAGVLLRLAGDIDGAVAAYERCLAINPNHALGRGNVSVALVDRANAMKARGDLNGAIREYERALTFAPDSAEAMYNLGVAQAEAGESDRAIIAYETTLKLHPRCAEAWNNLGVVLREQNNLERALECYRAASALNPTFAQPLNNAGVLYTAQGHAGLAHEALSAAIQADPTYAVAHNNLGCLLRDTGDVPEALACYERCARAEPDHRNATQNFLLGLNYVVPGEDPKVSDAHETWGRRFADLVRDSRLEERAFDPASDPEKIDPLPDGSPPARRLVVGYVSPDLYTHSVSYFASAPLRHHDARRFEVVVYSATPAPDARTASLRAAVESAHGRDAWRDVKDLTELELAELIRADGVDVLVELTGHTANNRLGAVARRPAPVQASWIGYPNSTGLAEVDYRITDRRCDPVGTKQRFAERLVRLPGCFLCYEPSPDAPASVAPAPCASAGFVTFGCFNALAKITPEVRATWARVLRRVPNSRLLLKAKPFACATIKARFLAHMAALGVEPWRVDLAPLRPSTAEHLATYGFVDVALDTFPYAGTTTTCEAMHAGVPVVTLGGKCHAHNVGASLCEAAGVERECVAETEEEYVEKCAALASDFDALQELRGKMRGKMENGALCDGPAFVRKLEKAYEEMWRRWCDEKSAECEGGGEGREEANAQTRKTTNARAE
jgi:predicted O-linked N-acetylglucosamine transferase (SPINDLY family)